jgi:cytoskeletal protein CcmA (bactofilin family)
MGAPTKASTIANEILITGNIMSNGEIHLEGQVQGDIQCASLVLGESAQLEGCAVAEEVVVGGRLIGSVRAVRLRLQASSHVEGDLLYQSLAMEQGAYFDGKSRPSDNPLSPQHGLVGRAADESVGSQTPQQPNELSSVKQKRVTERRE